MCWNLKYEMHTIKLSLNNTGLPMTKLDKNKLSLKKNIVVRKSKYKQTILILHITAIGNLS